MRFLTGAGSDYAAFMHYLGITSMDLSYTYDKVQYRTHSFARGGFFITLVPEPWLLSGPPLPYLAPPPGASRRVFPE